MNFFTEKKFRTLSQKQKHTHGALLLKNHKQQASKRYYRHIESWLSLPEIPWEFEAISTRYHYHLQQAGIPPKEHLFLTSPVITTKDVPSSVPFLPIAIYLDDLRSAHNVGSIMRTTEAFRLGTIHFSPKTPTHENKKVKDTAMGADTYVPTIQTHDLATLPKPLIALETAVNATPIYDFYFPEKFTLMLGNEEYGLGQKALALADHIVTIPLQGTKNSLNVANAFAIIASEIRKQRDLICN